MLVLTRKVGEAICIDENITVTVVKLSNGRVRIGIDAPKDIPIFRGELEQSVSAPPSHGRHYLESETSTSPSTFGVGG